MPFKPGNKLSRGRPKNAQNVDKRTVREIVEAALGKSLPEKIMELAKELERTNKPVALKAMTDLMKYSYPTFAAIHVTADAGTDNKAEKVSELANDVETIEADFKTLP